MFSDDAAARHIACYLVHKTSAYTPQNSAQRRGQACCYSIAGVQAVLPVVLVEVFGERAQRTHRTSRRGSPQRSAKSRVSMVVKLHSCFAVSFRLFFLRSFRSFRSRCSPIKIVDRPRPAVGPLVVGSPTQRSCSCHQLPGNDKQGWIG